MESTQKDNPGFFRALGRKFVNQVTGLKPPLWRRLLEVLGFAVFFYTNFNLLEHKYYEGYQGLHIIYTELDSVIPLWSAFIIPYYAWFAFIVFTFTFLIVWDKEGSYYHRFTRCFFFGQTFYLALSLVFPNGHLLQTKEILDQVNNSTNIFDRMLAALWRADTSTNIFPSMHVYDSVAAAIILMRIKEVRRHVAASVFVVVLAVSIVLSTMILKQHSALDVIAAVSLNLVYEALYAPVCSLVARIKARRGLGLGHSIARKPGAAVELNDFAKKS